MGENEEPCWLCGRAGFSKIDDLGKIVNYLPTSSVRLWLFSSFAMNARGFRALATWASRVNGCPPASGHIPTQYDPEVGRVCDIGRTCEMGYVVDNFIGFVCNR